MTKIRVKTPSLKKEATILLVDPAKGVWQIGMTGFTPINYNATDMHDAIDKGLALKDNLQVDPVVQAQWKARGEKLRLTRDSLAKSAAPVTAPIQAMPADQSGQNARGKDKKVSPLRVDDVKQPKVA